MKVVLAKQVISETGKSQEKDKWSLRKMDWGEQFIPWNGKSNKKRNGLSRRWTAVSSSFLEMENQIKRGMISHIIFGE